MFSRRVPGAIGQDHQSRRFWYFENSLYLYREQKTVFENSLTIRHLSWIISVLPPPNLNSQLQNIKLSKDKLQDIKEKTSQEPLVKKLSQQELLDQARMVVFEEKLDKFDPNFKLEIICKNMSDWQNLQFEKVLQEKECASFKKILNTTFLPFVKKLNVKLTTDPGTSGGSSPYFDYWDLPEFTENKNLKWFDPTRIDKMINSSFSTKDNSVSTKKKTNLLDFDVRDCCSTDKFGLTSSQLIKGETLSNTQYFNQLKTSHFGATTEACPSKSALRKTLNSVRDHPEAWLFRMPVDTTLQPDYFKMVKSPIDLLAIGKNVDRGQYNRVSDFLDDIRRVFINCRTYNGIDSDYFDLTNRLESSFCGNLLENNGGTTGYGNMKEFIKLKTQEMASVASSEMVELIEPRSNTIGARKRKFDENSATNDEIKKKKKKDKKNKEDLPDGKKREKRLKEKADAKIKEESDLRLKQDELKKQRAEKLAMIAARKKEQRERGISESSIGSGNTAGLQQNVYQKPEMTPSNNHDEDMDVSEDTLKGGSECSSQSLGSIKKKKPRRHEKKTKSQLVAGKSRDKSADSNQVGGLADFAQRVNANKHVKSTKSDSKNRAKSNPRSVVEKDKESKKQKLENSKNSFDDDLGELEIDEGEDAVGTRDKDQDFLDEAMRSVKK